jgi:hypothetical protein
MNRMMTRILCAASLGLSLGFATPARADVPCFPPKQAPCPPRYYQPCPTVVPYTPTESRPKDLPPSETPQQPSAQTPQAQAPQPDTTAPSDPTEGGGSGVYQLGRGDQNQRFNMFDHMSAIPRTRAWFGFQYMQDYTTGLSFTSSFASYVSSGPGSSDPGVVGLAEFASNRKIFLYRAGAEFATSCDCSIAAQWEYFTVNGDLAEDSFNNPQFLAKYVLSRNEGCVIAATLGFQPEFDIDPFEFNENHSRIYPGILFYSECCDWILQGGFQVGIPLKEDQIKTFDWSISLGYWLYRNPDCGGCDTPFCGKHTSCNGCTNGCGHSGIIGIIPQVNILGKHVLGDATVTNFFGIPLGFDPTPGSPGDEFTGAVFTYNEPRNVIDLTVGATVIMSNSCSFATGVSVPLTNDDVRNFEYIFYVNYNF